MVPENQYFVTGNTVIDALFWVRDRVMNNPELRASLADRYPFLDASKKMILVTGHRRESFGGGRICSALAEIARKHLMFRLSTPYISIQMSVSRLTVS